MAPKIKTERIWLRVSEAVSRFIYKESKSKSMNVTGYLTYLVQKEMDRKS